MFKICRKGRRLFSVLMLVSMFFCCFAQSGVVFADKENTTEGKGANDNADTEKKNTENNSDNTAENRIQQNYKLNAGQSMEEAGIDAFTDREIEYLGTFLSNFYIPFDTEIAMTDEANISEEAKKNRQSTIDYLTKVLTEQMYFEEGTAKKIVNGVIKASYDSATELELACTFLNKKDNKTSTKTYAVTFYDFLCLAGGGAENFFGLNNIKDEGAFLTKADLIFSGDTSKKVFTMKFDEDTGTPIMTASLTAFLSYYTNLDLNKGIGSCAMDADKSMYDLTNNDGFKKLESDLGDKLPQVSIVNWKMYVDCFGNILVNCGNGRRFVVLPACANTYRFQIRDGEKQGNSEGISPGAENLWKKLKNDDFVNKLENKIEKGNYDTSKETLRVSLDILVNFANTSEKDYASYFSGTAKAFLKCSTEMRFSRCYGIATDVLSSKGDNAIQYVYTSNWSCFSEYYNTGTVSTGVHEDFRDGTDVILTYDVVMKAIEMFNDTGRCNLDPEVDISKSGDVLKGYPPEKVYNITKDMMNCAEVMEYLNSNIKIDGLTYDILPTGKSESTVISYNDFAYALADFYLKKAGTLKNTSAGELLAFGKELTSGADSNYGKNDILISDREVTVALTTLMRNEIFSEEDLGKPSTNDNFKKGDTYNFTTLYNMTSAYTSDKDNFKIDDGDVLSAKINLKNMQKLDFYKLQRGSANSNFDTSWFILNDGEGGEAQKKILTRADTKEYICDIEQQQKGHNGLKYPTFKEYYYRDSKGNNTANNEGTYTYIIKNAVNEVVVLDDKGLFKDYDKQDYKAINTVTASDMAGKVKELKFETAGFSTTMTDAKNSILNKVSNGQEFLTGMSLSYLFAFYYDDGGRDKVSYRARSDYFPTVGSKSFKEGAENGGEGAGDNLQAEVLSLSYLFLHPTKGISVVATWFKNKISGTLLKWHSDMTGASNAKYSTGTTRYVSFTGYVTMPELKDVEWLDTIISYYNSLSVFLVIFMIVIMVLYIMSGNMTPQRAIVAVILFTFCVLLPPKAIDATVAASNKFSEVTYGDKFVYWALVQNESYLTDLNKAETATDYTDYLLDIYKTQLESSNITDNLVDVRWMTPKKYNYSAKIQEEAGDKITGLNIWKHLVNGTISAQISGEDYQRTANCLTLYRSYTDINSNSRYIYSNITAGKDTDKVTNGSYMAKIDNGNHPTLEFAGKYTDDKNKYGLIDAIKNGFNVDCGEHSGAKTGMKRFYGMTCSKAIAEQMNKVGKVKSKLTKADSKHLIGIDTKLYDWSLANFNTQKDNEGKALSSDTADIACFALMTESPYYYFSWNLFDQGMGTGTNGFTLDGKGLQCDGTAKDGYKNMILGTQDYFYNNQLKANIRGYGETRDFLDMRSLFTVVIPYLKEANELYMEYGRNFGFNLYDDVEYRYNAETWDKYEAIEDEQERNQTLKKYWHNCNVSQLLDMYTPWVDVMYECDYAKSETVHVMDKEYVVTDPLNPATYPYKEGRPMIFSKSEMIYYGLTEKDLTTVELKILNVADKTMEDMFQLVNYYNFSDVVLNNASAMLTTFNFNKEFSQINFFKGSHELYPQAFELKNFSYDAFMRLILENGTGESMTDDKAQAGIGEYTATDMDSKTIAKSKTNIYASITEKSSILTPIMLLVLDFMSIYIIPFFRFLFIILIFFMSIIMIIGGMVKAGDNMVSVTMKNLVKPLLSFLAVSCGMAFIVSMFMSNGYTGVTGRETFSISLGDPVMTIIAMILIDGVVIWLYFKMTRGMLKGVAQWGSVVLNSVQGAATGAVTSAFRAFNTSRRSRELGRELRKGFNGETAGAGGRTPKTPDDVENRGGSNARVTAGATAMPATNAGSAPSGMSEEEINQCIANGQRNIENSHAQQEQPKVRGFFGRRADNMKARFDRAKGFVDDKVQRVNATVAYAKATADEVKAGAGWVAGKVKKGSAFAKDKAEKGFSVVKDVAGKRKNAVSSGVKKASLFGQKTAEKSVGTKRSLVQNTLGRLNQRKQAKLEKQLNEFKVRDNELAKRFNSSSDKEHYSTYKSEATKALEGKYAQAVKAGKNYSAGNFGIVARQREKAFEKTKEKARKRRQTEQVKQGAVSEYAKKLQTELDDYRSKANNYANNLMHNRKMPTLDNYYKDHATWVKAGVTEDMLRNYWSTMAKADFLQSKLDNIDTDDFKRSVFSNNDEYKYKGNIDKEMKKYVDRTMNSTAIKGAKKDYTADVKRAKKDFKSEVRRQNKERKQEERRLKLNQTASSINNSKFVTGVRNSMSSWQDAYSQSVMSEEDAAKLQARREKDLEDEQKERERRIRENEYMHQKADEDAQYELKRQQMKREERRAEKLDRQYSKANASLGDNMYYRQQENDITAETIRKRTYELQGDIANIEHQITQLNTDLAYASSETERAEIMTKVNEQTQKLAEVKEKLVQHENGEWTVKAQRLEEMSKKKGE